MSLSTTNSEPIAQPAPQTQDCPRRAARDGGFRLYLTILLATVGVVLICIALFNLTVDPFGGYRLLKSDSFARFKTGNSTRVGKAETLRNHPWDIILLGNSRVEVGLDPQNPAWGDSRVFNCGLPGTDFDELDQACRLAMKNPTVKRIFLCLDLSDFDPTRMPPDNFRKSRFNPSLNPIEYHLTDLLSIDSIEHSFRTLSNARHDRPTSPTPLGNSTDKLRANGHSDWVLTGYYDFADPQHRSDSPRRTISPARLHALSSLLDQSGQDGVEINLVILPMHAIYFERLAVAGEFDLHFEWLKSLSSIAANHRAKLWDFCTYNQYTTEQYPEVGQTVTNMKWFWDPVHFKKELGDVVVHRLQEEPAQGTESSTQFGKLISSGTIDEHVRKIKQDYEAYTAGRN